MSSVKEENENASFTSMLIAYLKNIIIIGEDNLKQSLLNTGKWFKSFGFGIQLFLYFFFVFIIILTLLFHIRKFIYSSFFQNDYQSGLYFQYNKAGILKEQSLTQATYSYYITKDEAEAKLNQILLMKIYLKELIGHGLIKGTVNSFDSIADFAADYNDYLSTDEYHYSIAKNAIEKYIDNNSKLNNIGEIAKVSFLFTPLLIQEAEINNDLLTTVYILPYQYKKATSNVFDRELYFAYPTMNYEYSDYQNFNQLNNKIEPMIDSKFTDLLSTNDEFHKENWFIMQDYQFRNQLSSSTPLTSQYSLYNHAELIVNIAEHYQFSVMQYALDNDSTEPIVINIIFKYKNNQVEPLVERSSFLIQNNTIDTSDQKLLKYSNNSTFVITKNAIASLKISKKFLEYYSFTIKRLNNLYYGLKVNYDTYDLEHFYNIDSYYSMKNERYYDILLHKVINFYYQITLLILNNPPVYDPLYYIYKYNNTNEIKRLCDSFDLVTYYHNLTLLKEELNCFSDKQLFYYYYSHGEEYDPETDQQIPSCLCLPFYCLNKTTSNIKKRKLIYTKNLSIPNRCESELLSYYNPSFYQSKDILSSSSFLRFFITYDNILYMNNITLMNIQLFLKNDLLVCELLFDKAIKSNIQEILFLFIIIVFIIIFVLLIISTIRIYKYKDYLIFFTKNYGEKILDEDTEINESDDIKTIILPNPQQETKTKTKSPKIPKKRRGSVEDDLINSNEPITLTEVNHIIPIKQTNEEILIDKLYKDYCDFYKIKNDIILYQDKENSPIKECKDKLYDLSNYNELFDILSLFIIKSSNYQFHPKDNINFYRHHKLIKKYIAHQKSSGSYDYSFIQQTNNNFSSTNPIPSIYQSILCEVLSTESIFDEGVIYNFKFNYKYNNILYENYNLCEKRPDTFYQHCGYNTLTKYDEIKAAFNYYITQVYYQSVCKIFRPAINSIYLTTKKKLPD